MTSAADEQERYYADAAAAYMRGALPAARDMDDAAAIAHGQQNGVRLHRFKRTTDLPRVRAVLGALQGIQPQNLLDIGTGRGVFLWPLLAAFPLLEVTATDLLDHRVAMLQAVHDGGIDRLGVHQMSATDLAFEAGAFDVSTALEVLEHMQDPDAAVRELVRVSRRFIVASVPSKADENPEHIQLFGKATFGDLFTKAGAKSINISYVRGHIICVAGL